MRSCGRDCEHPQRKCARGIWKRFFDIRACRRDSKRFQISFPGRGQKLCYSDYLAIGEGVFACLPDLIWTWIFRPFIGVKNLAINCKKLISNVLEIISSSRRARRLNQRVYLQITKIRRKKETFERCSKAYVYYWRLRRFGFAHESLDFYSLACAARIFFL